MPVERITSGENVEVGIKVETTNGVQEQAVYDVFQTRGGEVDYPEEIATDETKGDHGGPLDKRTVSRGGDASFPMHLRHDGNTTLFEAALRDSFPTPVTIVGASNINVVLGGTHLDGSTGPQITAPATTFDSLITYASATANGAEGLMMLVSGFAQADNNTPRAIKAVHDSGTATIDIYPGYIGGSASDPFGAPMIAETLQSATIRVGEGMRNRQKGSDANRSWSLMFDYCNHVTEARFNALRGWTANDLQLAISGKGEVLATVNGNGRGWSPLSMTPQNGQVLDSHFADNTPNTPMYIGGEDLQFLAIVPYANAVVPTTVPIVLSDMNVKAVDTSLAGNVEVVGDIVGTDEVIPKTGMHDPNGSLGWYMTDDAIARRITEIGSKDLGQYGALHMGFKDDNNLWVIYSYLKCNFGNTGPNPGGGGAVEGTLNFGGLALTPNARAVVYQQIDEN